MKLHENTTIDLAAKGAALGIAFYLLKKYTDDQKRKGAEALTDENVSVRLAQLLRQALNPSGNGWMVDLDGTNEDLIKSTASQITDLKEVAKWYESQYQESLYARLQKELSPEDYQKFLNLIQKKDGNNGNPPKRNDIPANYWVLSEKETNARSQPKKDSPYNPFTNIIKTFAPEKIIGISTGRYAYDTDNDVLFVELWAYNKKQKKIFFYVAKSQVSFISEAEKKKREAKGKKLQFDILDGLGKIETSNHEKVIVSLKAITIYNEKFEEVGKAPANILLGFPIMNLKTAKGNWQQFETVQGLKRWVKETEVKTQNRE